MDGKLTVLGGDTHFREPLMNFGLDLGCYQKIANLVVDLANERIDEYNHLLMPD